MPTSFSAGGRWYTVADQPAGPRSNIPPPGNWGGGASLVTDFPQFLSHANSTETGNGTTGYTYTGAGTGDSDMGNTSGKGITLAQNGRFECTVKSLLLFNAFLAQSSDTAVGLAAAALYGGNINASTYKTVIAGTANGAVNRGSGLNVGAAFPATDSDVLILEFIGTKPLLKLRPTGASNEYVLHSFGTARSGTLYMGAKFFNVGEVLSIFKRIIGNPYRPWTTSANAIIAAGNSFFDQASDTEFIGQIQDAYPICGNDTTFTNLGIVGATWADIQANQLAGANAAYIAAGARLKHIIFSENSNTVIQQGLNAAATIAAAKACIGAFLSGKTYSSVGMLRQPPRCAGTTISNDATRLAQNNVMEAVWATWLRALAPTASRTSSTVTPGRTTRWRRSAPPTTPRPHSTRASATSRKPRPARRSTRTLLAPGSRPRTSAPRRSRLETTEDVMKHLFLTPIALACTLAHAQTSTVEWTLSPGGGKYATQAACDAAAKAATAANTTVTYDCPRRLKVVGKTVVVPPVTPPAGNLPFVDKTKLMTPFAGWNKPLIRPVSSTQLPTKSEDGSFREPALISHMNFDDPIIFPGQPGASHLHVYAGPPNIDANSTTAGLAACPSSTNGGGTLNCSAYWSPAMIDTTDGTPVAPSSMLIYYKTGYGGVDTTKIQPVPAGLRMVSGSSANSTEAGVTVSRFVCYGGATGVGWQKSIPTNCNTWNTLVMEVSFPQCWDGKNLDSPDHKSHMAETTGSGCPATHPVALPHISYEWYYDLAKVDIKRMAKWRLSSDNYPASSPGGYSAHGDYWMAWDAATMKQIVVGCLNASMDCHAGPLNNGQELYIP
jgi:hypothetical protein